MRTAAPWHLGTRVTSNAAALRSAPPPRPPVGPSPPSSDRIPHLFPAESLRARTGRAAARRGAVTVQAAKELHFNTNGDALKRMQAGVDKLATVVGVTLGPKGRNVVLESKFGSPKIVNDGVTVAKEVQLADPVENIGAKLVIQAASKTNDLAGDGTTTATILSAALIAEGMKVVAAGANPIQIVRGIEKVGVTARRLPLLPLSSLFPPVQTDSL